MVDINDEIGVDIRYSHSEVTAQFCNQSQYSSMNAPSFTSLQNTLNYKNLQVTQESRTFT